MHKCDTVFTIETTIPTHISFWWGNRVIGLNIFGVTGVARKSCRKSRRCPALGTWWTTTAPALKNPLNGQQMGKERLYLSICWFIYKSCLKPHPQLTKEKFSLMSAARIRSWKRKHHVSLSVSSIILNQKTFMTSNTLYIKRCYEGFNIYITQIPLCLNVFKGAISSTFSQPWCSFGAWMCL